MATAPLCPACGAPHHLGEAKPGTMLLCMATAPLCPACGAPHHLGEAKPGTMLLCGACCEVFHAPEDGTSPAISQTNEPLASDGRPASTNAPKRDERADDPKTQSRHPDRETRDGNRGGVVLLLFGGTLAAFLVLAVVGGVRYFVQKADEEARARVEDERREAERLKAEAEAEARANKPPVKGNNPPTEDKQPVEPAPIAPAAAVPKLRELRAVALPPLDVKPAPPAPNQLSKLTPGEQAALRTAPPADFFKIAHAPKHELLFVITPKSVWIYDLKAKKELMRHEAKHAFTDLSLSPDQSALFLTDFGGQRGVGGEPISPSYVHWFETAARKLETRKAPRVGWKVEAVDANRVLLLEGYTYCDLTLNRWDDRGGITELDRAKRSEYYGDIEYEPRSGRVLHGNAYVSSHRIKSHIVEGDRILPGEFTGAGLTTGFDVGTANEHGGGSSVLSRDGLRFYYGKLQVSADAIKENVQVFPEVIVAASRTVAFGSKAYYSTDTGEKLGAFGFKTSAGTDEKNPLDSGSPPVFHVSADGRSLWVIDRDKNVVRQFAINGEK